MLIKRLLFVVVGVAIAGLAVLLVLWGLSALRSDPAGSSDASVDSAANPKPEAGGPGAGESRQWQEFTGGTAQSSEQVVADLRPIERQTRAAGRPFDQAYARKQLDRLGFRLEGVAHGEQPLALISGRVVRIGDRIEGYRVESIERSGVLLIGPTGIRFDLAPQTRSATQENLSAGRDPAVRPTAPNLKPREKLKNEDLPSNRSKTRSQGPFSQSPVANMKREREKQKRQR